MLAMNRICFTLILLLNLVCSLRSAAAQKVTVVLYDVRAHKYVPGGLVSILPLSAHNLGLAYDLYDPKSNPINLGLEATTDLAGRATFEVGELLPIVDRVNKELAESARMLITKHYEVSIFVFARGYQCSPGLESLHHILEAGTVEDIEARPCKS